MKLYTFLLQTTLIITLSVIIRNVDAYYLPVQFYYPKLGYTEPRIQKDWLTSAQACVSRGATSHALNCQGQRVPLFDLYGIQDLSTLTSNVIVNSGEQSCLANLPPLPNNVLSISGHFRFRQTLVGITQNICNGFFVSCYLPIRRLGVSMPRLTNLTPAHQEAFIPVLDATMACFNLNRTNSRPVGLGDVVACAGKTWCLFDNPHLDFIDISLQAGFMAPTSKKRNENQIFSLPFGFDGHAGFLLVGDCSVGAYDWLTVGAHLDILIFTSVIKTVRIKTDLQQNGIIFLQQARAGLVKKPQCSVSAYIKADHFTRGFSIVGSYSFTYQGHTELTLFNRPLKTEHIANTDNRFAAWSMHTIHAALEYDFTTRNDIAGPRIGIFYDRPVSGRNIFLTALWTGAIGIDICLNF